MARKGNVGKWVLSGAWVSRIHIMGDFERDI